MLHLTCLYPIRASSRSSSSCIVAMLPCAWLGGAVVVFVYDGGKSCFSVDLRTSTGCTASMIVVNTGHDSSHQTSVRDKKDHSIVSTVRSLGPRSVPHIRHHNSGLSMKDKANHGSGSASL